MLDYNKSYEEIKPHLKDIPFAYKPGEDYSYQNVAYSLIGDVLQSVTGEDYNTLLRKRIFEPFACIRHLPTTIHRFRPAMLPNRIYVQGKNFGNASR